MNILRIFYNEILGPCVPSGYSPFHYQILGWAFLMFFSPYVLYKLYFYHMNDSEIPRQVSESDIFIDKLTVVQVSKRVIVDKLIVVPALAKAIFLGSS